jgi:hypothetical protein
MSSRRGRAWLLALAVALPPGARADTGTEAEGVRQRAVAWVRALEFKALDAQADAWRRSRARVADGRWKLALLYEGLEEGLPEIVADETRRRALESAVDDYVVLHPRSANAGLFRAKVYEAEGWAARGLGLANTIPPGGSARFRSAMGQARDALDRGREAMAANPHWYKERIDIATYLGEDPTIGAALLHESSIREPRYLPTWFAALAQATPRWGGSERAMMAFANDANRDAPEATRAEGLYAALVWTGSSEYPGMLDDAALDWPAMRRSMDTFVHRYPAERNAQKLLFMACRRADKGEARKLLPLIRQPASEEALGHRNVAAYQQCLDWAHGKVAAFVMHGPELGADQRIE